MAKTAQNDCFGFCSYCGCGCRLKLQVSQSSIEKILQDKSDPVSEGNCCIKGLAIHEVIKSNRLRKPMFRPVKCRGLIECSWEKAFGVIKSKLDELEEYDDNGIHDFIFFIPDGQSTNETNYLFSKLCRSHFHSNNIDSCARLCHQSTAVAFNKMLGIPAIPEYSMDSLRKVDVFLMAGTDPAEDYPAMFNRILDAKRKGAKIITLDVTSTSTTDVSDINMSVTSDGVVPFISWLITKFVDSDKISKDVRQFHGFGDFVESAKKVSQNFPPSTFGLSEEKMNHIFETIKDGKKIGICFGMGVTQHSNGTQNVESLIGLGLILNAVIFPNRGKVNVQGASDVGGYPEWDSERIKDAGDWNTKYRNHKGRMLTEALYDKDIKFVWAIGGDISQSMPDLNLLDESLRHKFVVYQGHHPARIMDFASVVLPTTIVTEENGTITNGERRVRGVENNIGQIKDVKTGFEIVTEFAKFVNAKGFSYRNEKEVTDEIIKIVPGYEDLHIPNICSDEGQFADKKPKFKKFNKIKFDFGHFQGEGDYPFILTTSRSKYQFCTGNESRNSKTLHQLAKDPLVFMNPKDMDYVGVSDGQEVRIISEVGEVKTKVFKNADVSKRMIIAQFHFPKLLINKLTSVLLDPQSGTPCFKEVPVRIDVLI